MPGSRCGVLLVFCVSPCLMVSCCPAGCCCPPPGLLVLCESLGLQSLPRSVPLDTSALSVARNQLCNIDDLLQPFSELQELSLNHNHLSRFPRGLPSSLESLLLQENRITYITSGGLRYLGNLSRLDLEHNQIRAVQPGAFQRLSKLTVLTLRGNRLSSLPRHLPGSLTHLDVSANCISALDLASLSSLVNLQVLKVNSNCLRSVPDSAFDRLPRLRSVSLSNNLWVCECDILYLYRWLLSGRVRMATDLVCTAPRHLAHRLLLNLSVMAICPHVLELKRTVLKDAQPSPETGFLKHPPHLSDQVANNTRLHPGHLSLETQSYQECMSLNKTPSATPFYSKTSTVPPDEQLLCRLNVTGQSPETNGTSTEESRALGPTAEPQALQDEPQALQDSVVVALLALLCVLVAVLTLAVLIVLKTILVRHQRVAPLESGSR